MELLEREPFLMALREALAAARAEGRIALVFGEAGIGKTSLVDRFAATARAQARVLWGACDSLHTPQPLAPLHDIAASLPGALAARLRGAERPAEIFAALFAALRDQASVVIIEDLHWADAATLDLVKFLGRRIHLVPTLLVLTYRDDELGARHPLRVLLGDLATAKSVVRIALPPLSAGAVGRLAGVDVDAAALHRHTGGNPFFVTEVLASGAAVPATVRDAVLARVARLTRVAREAIETVAVIGARVDAVLLAASGASPGAADECVTRGVLRAEDRAVAFRHELARQSVLEAVAPQRLRALHRRVLAALRAAPTADPARLAHHAEAAGDAAAVREFAPEAARRGAAVGAHREAAAQYARALRFAVPAERASLLEAYAEECALLDEGDESMAALNEALALRRAQGDRLMTGENLARMVALLLRSGRDADAARASREAIATLKTQKASRQLARAYGIHAFLQMINRHTEPAIRWGRKTIALARRLGDAKTVAEGHRIVGAAMLQNDDLGGCAEIERSQRIAGAAGLDGLVALGFHNMGSVLGERFHLDAADRCLSAGIAYAAERDLDYAHQHMLARLALVRLYQGRWAEAGDLASDVVRRPTVATASRSMALAALGRLRARRGDPDAEAALDEALDLVAQTRMLLWLGVVRTARAEAAWLAGDHARVIAEVRGAHDLALRCRHKWFGAELAFWRKQVGESVVAPRWFARPYAAQITGAWRKAAAEWERLGCPYERARALADGDSAAQLVALEIFDRLGARPAADILRRKMRRGGLAHIPRGPRAATRDNPFGLTARELEILGRIAGGLSNAAIGAQLRISRKTVGHHVSAVLAKLEVPSRGAAVLRARERGLLR